MMDPIRRDDDDLRDQVSEIRAEKTAEMVESAAEEAEAVLVGFWSTVRELRGRIAQSGVAMPEQLNRESRR
jgi:hypothetical protein